MLKAVELSHFAEAYRNKRFALWYDTCAAWFDRQGIDADVSQTQWGEFFFRARLSDSEGAYFAGVFQQRAKSVAATDDEGAPLMKENKKGEIVARKRPETADEFAWRVERECSEALRMAREERMRSFTHRPIAARAA